MTRLAKKKYERMFVEEAANLLGKAWDLGKCREHPDFIVTESQHQFGLEVRQIFRRLETSGGSAEKRGESHRQEVLAKLRNRYEEINNIPLNVRLLGDMRDDLMEKVFDVLVKQDLSLKPPGYHMDFELDDELHVYVTRAFRPDWICVNDRVGWVNRKPEQVLMDAIKKKSKHLSDYQKHAGSDVRLLLVADCVFNSGKLELEEELELDRKGFRVVYLYTRPQTVLVF